MENFSNKFEKFWKIFEINFENFGNFRIFVENSKIWENFAAQNFAKIGAHHVQFGLRAWSSQAKACSGLVGPAQIEHGEPQFWGKNFATQNFLKIFAIAKILPKFRIAKFGAYHVQFGALGPRAVSGQPRLALPSGPGRAQIEHGKLEFSGPENFAKRNFLRRA